MKETLDKYYKNCSSITLVSVLLFMTVVTGICNQISIGELAAFGCFQIFCILLPGIVIMTLIPIKNLRRIERLALVYATGYILSIIIYALVMLLCGRAYVRAAFILTAILAAVILALKRNRERQSTEMSGEVVDDVMWIWTTLIFFFMSLFAFSLRWKAPYDGGINYYEDDFLYWVGDIVALTKKVPPVNFRSLSPDYRYHYLGAMQQAVISNVTGITVIKTATYFSYIESAVIVGLSTCALVNRVIKNKTVRVLTVLLTLFSTGYELAAGPTYIPHMYLIPMSYNIAQSLGVLVVLLLLLQLRNETIDFGNLGICLCCLLCCTGTKSAAGAVIFCGFVFTYLYRLLLKSSKKTVCIMMGIIVGIFIVIGIYLWPTVKAYQIAIRLPRIYLRTGEGIAQSVYACVDWIIGYIESFIQINLWTFIPTGFYGIYLIIHKRVKREQVLLLIMIAVGTIGNYFIVFYGISQMYFALIVFPFAALMTGCCLEEIFLTFSSKKWQYLAGGIISVMVISFTLCAHYKGWLLKFFAAGLENIDVVDVVEEGDVIFPVTQAECEAYCWINENTDQDAFLLSDRTLEDIRDPLGIFAERYVYCYANVDAKKQGKACFEGDQEMLEMYAEQGVNYIVQTKERSPKFNCSADIGEVVFENEEVAVYEIH